VNFSVRILGTNNDDGDNNNMEMTMITKITTTMMTMTMMDLLVVMEKKVDPLGLFSVSTTCW